MAEAARQWLKAYASDLSSPKLQRLSWAQRGIWHSLQLLSLQVGHPQGTFLDEDEQPLTADEIVDGLRCIKPDDRRLARACLDVFVDMRLLAWSKAGGYEIAGWGDRQSRAISDTPEERNRRQRRHRERLRGQRTGTDDAPALPEGVTPLRRRGDEHDA